MPFNHRGRLHYVRQLLPIGKTLRKRNPQYSKRGIELWPGCLPPFNSIDARYQLALSSQKFRGQNRFRLQHEPCESKQAVAQPENEAGERLEVEEHCVDLSKDGFHTANLG
jgi:hypothetical protein